MGRPVLPALLSAVLGGTRAIFEAAPAAGPATPALAPGAAAPVGDVSSAVRAGHERALSIGAARVDMSEGAIERRRVERSAGGISIGAARVDMSDVHGARACSAPPCQYKDKSPSIGRGLRNYAGCLRLLKFEPSASWGRTGGVKCAGVSPEVDG